MVDLWAYLAVWHLGATVVHKALFVVSIVLRCIENIVLLIQVERFYSFACVKEGGVFFFFCIDESKRPWWYPHGS